MSHGKQEKPKFVQGSKKHLDEPIMGCNFIEWSGHAQQRMSQRSITPAKVLLALRNPSRSNLPADFPHKRIEYRLTPRKWLQVVYDIKTDCVVVITVYIEE